MVLFVRGGSRLVGTAEAFGFRPQRGLAQVAAAYYSHTNYNHHNSAFVVSSGRHRRDPFHRHRQPNTVVVTTRNPRWMSMRGGQREEEPSTLWTQDEKMPKQETKELADDKQAETKDSLTPQKSYKRPKSIVVHPQTVEDESSFSWKHLFGNRLVSSWRRSFRRRAGEIFTIGVFL